MTATRYWADQARAALAAARAELCPCGIRRTRCSDHRADDGDTDQPEGDDRE